jgi:sirohydrochlorin cobaltochelatase
MSAAPLDQHALILFGHGARDPQWARPLLAVRAAIHSRQPACRVELAFLELMAPSLDECVTALVEQGVTRVSLIPMFMAQSGHLTRDLPAQAQALQARYPQLTIDIQAAIGEAPAVQAAMAEYALAALAG